MNFPVELPEHILALASELQVRPEDIEEQFIHGSGHGGQKINKRSKRVFLRHIPTGIQVRCQKRRHQHENRVDAYVMLIEQIADQRELEKRVERYNAFQEQKQAARRRPRKVKEKILKEKKKRGEVKEMRGKIL